MNVNEYLTEYFTPEEGRSLEQHLNARIKNSDWQLVSHAVISVENGIVTAYSLVWGRL